MYVDACSGPLYMPWHLHEGWRTTCGNQFFLSSHQMVPGIEVPSSGLAASAFTQQAITLPHLPFYIYLFVCTCLDAHVTWCTYSGQKTTYKSWFSSSTMWDFQKTQVESSFTHQVIFCLPADSPNPHFWNKVSNWNIGLAPAIHLSPLPSTGIISAMG